MKLRRKYIIIVLALPFILMLFLLNNQSHFNNNKPLLTVYRYISSDYGFEDIEVVGKGRTLDMVEQAFEEYKKSNNLSDVELRIATKPNEWDDLNHRRWRYEFIEGKE